MVASRWSGGRASGAWAVAIPSPLGPVLCRRRDLAQDRADLPQRRLDRLDVLRDPEQDQFLAPRNGVAISVAISSGVKPWRFPPCSSSRRATSVRSRYQPPIISRTDAATIA